MSKIDEETINTIQTTNNSELFKNIIEYLEKVNFPPETIDKIIKYIENDKEELNISLFIEILVKSYGYIEIYTIEEIIEVVGDVHDIYKENVQELKFEEYCASSEENKMKKLFLNDNKYCLKSLKDNINITTIVDLKFAAATTLEQKEYQDFIAYIDDYSHYQETYSPLILLKTYTEVRNNLEGKIKLFWDLVFGNEYLVSLNKNHITINQIFKNNNQTKSFQIITIYNSKDLPVFKKEQDFINYYRMLGENKEEIVLPKLTD